MQFIHGNYFADLSFGFNSLALAGLAFCLIKNNYLYQGWLVPSQFVRNLETEQFVCFEFGHALPWFLVKQCFWFSQLCETLPLFLSFSKRNMTSLGTTRYTNSCDPQKHHVKRRQVVRDSCLVRIWTTSTGASFLLCKGRMRQLVHLLVNFSMIFESWHTDSFKGSKLRIVIWIILC